MLELNLVSRCYFLDNFKRAIMKVVSRAFNLFKYISSNFFVFFLFVIKKNYNVSIPINSIYPASNSFKLIYRIKNAYLLFFLIESNKRDSTLEENPNPLS